MGGNTAFSGLLQTSKMTTHARLKRGAPEEEDASQLRFNEDFRDAQCLFVSEVKLVLDEQRQIKSKEGVEHTLTPVFEKTSTYVDQFSRFSTRESVKEVRKILNKEQFRPFEIAQLANLCCEEAEEAKSLIPSLTTQIDDDSLQTVLSEMMTLKKFQM